MTAEVGGDSTEEGERESVGTVETTEKATPDAERGSDRVPVYKETIRRRWVTDTDTDTDSLLGTSIKW